MATTSNVLESYPLSDGTMIYKVNGIKVSQEEYNRKNAEQKVKIEAGKNLQKENLESVNKKREKLLESLPKNSEERIKKAQKQLNLKKGGLVKKKKTKKTKKTNSRSIAKKYFKGIF
jgi:uncharacterized membrane protein YcaP (DUF421 family)